MRERPSSQHRYLPSVGGLKPSFVHAEFPLPTTQANPSNRDWLANSAPWNCGIGPMLIFQGNVEGRADGFSRPR